jgi:methyl-accepting chemotaxis protein
VVAEEVRKLAEDSSRAAHEISGLIGAIQTETTKAVSVVQNGAKRTQESATVVGQTREAFERIEGSVQDITARIEQIATASQQIAAGAQELSGTAEELNRLVAQFTLTAE